MLIDYRTSLARHYRRDEYEYGDNDAQYVHNRDVESHAYATALRVSMFMMGYKKAQVLP